MLAGDFYHIQSLQIKEASLEAEIVFNKTHPVFSGHFPGQPVVPGACQLQIIKEIWEQQKGKHTLQVAHTIKFLQPIDPVQQNKASLLISWKEADDSIQVSASVTVNEKTCSKFGMVFIP